MNTLHSESQYYLHTNGSVIFKPHGGVDATSDFVSGLWNANAISETPESYLKWLMEIADKGANVDRVKELFYHSKLNDFISGEAKKEFMHKLMKGTPNA